MASSDEDEELVPQSVTNYYFVDEKEEPVSFSVLPDCLDEKERPDATKEEVFLHGDGDGGLQKLFKQVTAWRLELEDAQPEVTVLTKDNRWINLSKPRKSYEGLIRTILITVQLLHFLRRRPESTEKSLWDHLRKVFSTYEDQPSVNDLISHYPLIQMIVDRNGALAKSQLLLMLLKERPRKKSFDEDLQNDSDSKKPFIVDDVLEDIGNDDGDQSEEEPDLFDSVCAICDNGGELLCCEGRCMRSFHATRKDGEDSECKSLGFSILQVEAIQNFLCKNCKYKQHQCYVCGKLGFSDKSSGAEVFPCVNATCGYFYHPKCVAELLFQENEVDATEYEKKIASGKSFTCPAHKCHVCKQGENKENKELQFAVCRRCPKSYHRKCLPGKIAFEDEENEEVIPRAWEGLLPNQILIYCLYFCLSEFLFLQYLCFKHFHTLVTLLLLIFLVDRKHKIDEDLGTPIRNHIIFPEIPERRKVMALEKSKGKVLVKKIRKVSDDGSRERASIKPLKATGKLSNTKQVLYFPKQLKPFKVNAEPDLQKSDGPVSLNAKKYPKEKANAAAPTTSTLIANVSTSSYPKFDVLTEKKVIALMENISPSLTRESIWQKRTIPSTHSHTARNIDRLITLGKVEGSVEAIKTALRKVEDGSTVEDARAVCEPDVIKQVVRWNNDFNFEKKDWMDVQPKDLPIGSQLIMGLNPPFGVKASLANKFINKALTYKPKLVILIVPSDTERLDRKRSPYDLIWEDSEKLSGMSFYLPGSVDVNDMQMDQWNNKPPPLYLWSRPDWTTKHRAIALKQGHISQVQQETPAEKECEAQRLDVRLPEERISEVSAREVDNEKFATESKKRSSPEDHINRSAKRKKEKRKEHAEAKKREEEAKRKHREEAKIKEEAEAKKKDREEAKRKDREVAKSKDREAADSRKEGELSDMSISPPHTSREVSMNHLPLETFETPSEPFQTTTERRRNQRPGLELGTITETERKSSVAVEDIVDVARRYTTPSSGDALFSSSSLNWSGDRIGNQDYPIQRSEERYSAYGSLDTFSRNPFADGYGKSLDPDTRMLQSRPYGLLGEDEPLQRSRFGSGIPDSALGRHNDAYPSPSYGLSSSMAFPNSALGSRDTFPSSSHGLSGLLAGSVTQRYAARLDEANAQGAPFPGGSSNIFDPHAIRRDMPPSSFGFAPEPQHPFPRQNSSGWLDD